MQLKANTIEDGILYVDNLQPMALVPKRKEKIQVNPDDALEDMKEVIYFFGFQININVSFIYKQIVKATIHPL